MHIFLSVLFSYNKQGSGTGGGGGGCRGVTGVVGVVLVVVVVGGGVVVFGIIW